MLPAFSFAQTAPKITTPKEFFGFNMGDDYHMASYTQAEAYWKKLATESNRMKLVEIGKTEEGRPQYMAIVSSPENLKKLDYYKSISQKLAHAEISEEEAHKLAQEGKAIVWVDGGLHATETVGSQQLIEIVYQMLSRTDPETMRLLNDDIALYTFANPDGMELVANWYMREKDETKRSYDLLPRLYAKYVGHDDNRDSLTSNMAETANMNRQLFIEWNPQLMYNHHQSGPAGEVIYIPPLRDPVNHNLDPLVTLGIEQVGVALHERLVSQDKGGSGMRTQANYDGWWDGGMRNTTTFHNTIALLTEIIGNPTPIQIPLIPERQLYISDRPLPVAPQTWHYRQSIDYCMETDRAMLDYASRRREIVLWNFYKMGRNSIERGSKDYWTITPKRIDALEAAGKVDAASKSAPDARGRVTLEPSDTVVPSGLYESVLHDPNFRDPRGYIISADQPDFPTATKFVNMLLKNGLDVHQATASFTVAGKTYPAGSYVVKTAQAFRPMVREMFEPQDHPHDVKYPGGPPITPYDIAGWTLAMQMGVQYDKIQDGFDGPFKLLDKTMQPYVGGGIVGPANPAGYLVSHRVNNSVILQNRLLKAGADVFWLKSSVTQGKDDLNSGTLWVPASGTATPILEKNAKELGLTIYAVPTAPTGEAYKLKPLRIAIYDQFGGILPAGWTRWLFERFEFPFEMVYPQTLDKGDLKSKYDVIIFTDGAFRRGLAGRGNGGQGAKLPDDIPAEFQGWTGRITEATTFPQIKAFLNDGGSIVTVGSSTVMAEILGLPISNYLVERAPGAPERPLAREKFFIPGSLMEANIDNTVPLAYGMPDKVNFFFDSSPIFRLAPNASSKHTYAAAWFSKPQTLTSGWAWGQEYLNGGTAAVAGKLGKGNVIVLGPEVSFRGEPHGTFKLLFNGVMYGGLEPTTLGK
ncbi:M14 metallopeptidase family protein [Granulicella sp. WH15]|uniref:M14 family metallopeptidase n=1 Tax=Granulicella sp. WH15 TaxID=2602070 RepID=UPI001C705B87|nr:M14 metallopeptidase family protein [Granulicella sp. WH15]